MVKINKSPLPKAIKCENDYRTDPVFSVIRQDCFNKCYICEDKGPTGINVEHRIPHKGSDAIKYDWDNLLLSCYHCNHIKLAHHTILDPAKIDPEDYIALTMNTDSLKEQVLVEKIKDCDKIEETINLLQHVYNGENTAMAEAECENLRNKILKELMVFKQQLFDYYDETDMQLKNAYKVSIQEKFMRSAAFAAFKRKIIRDNPKYVQEFGESLT